MAESARPWRIRTRAIHSGQPNDAHTGAVSVPIYQTSTFAQIEPGVHHGYSYARTDHPTREALEQNLAALENAQFGLAYASGMAAINGVLAILRSGDHVVSTRDLYGGAWRIFTKLYAKFGIEFTFVDTSNLEEVRAAGLTDSREPEPASADAPQAERLEKTSIEEAILRAGGSVSRAAEELGLSRQALYRKMEKLGIVLERRPK